VLLQLMKKKQKKQKTEDLQFIDVHEEESCSHKINNEVHQSPVNCVHFAQQEDDSDLAASSPVKMVRKHLALTRNCASVNSVTFKGLNECRTVVRFIYLNYLIW
jgi:hypothetical protein